MAINKLPTTGGRLVATFAGMLLLSCGWIDLGGDQGIGRPCSIEGTPGPSQGVYVAGASECPSKLCLKPSVQPGASGSVDTGPTCSGECGDIGDSCDGETRDMTNPSDTRCSKGFVCAVPFVKGQLCCKKLCVCKDFLGPMGAANPIACQGQGARTCAGEEPPVDPTAEEQTDAYVHVDSVRQLDLVTMVDNSPNMAPKIAKLNASFPALLETLRDPNDGTLPDLRVAIITSDLGTRGAYENNACPIKYLADGTASVFGDLGRFQMLSSPTACSFTPASLFLEHKAGLPLSYTGDLGTVFSCLTSNLGTAGCFQEHPLQSFEFALAAQGVGNEVQQQAFLRPSAHLGLIFLSDEDDCSAAPNDGLFGDFPETRSESPSLRCATRGHRCDGQNLTNTVPGYPTASAFAAPFASCQARLGDECPAELDTSKPTSCNPLKSIAELANEIKSLKANPDDQVTVAGIFGWPRSDAEMATALYKIAPVPNPNTADPLNPTIFDYWPVCYDPNHLPSPATTDPLTGFDATAAAWGATGGLREAAYVDKFGANGMKFSICEPDFTVAMQTIGGALSRKMQDVCIDRKLVDVDPATAGIQPDCRVVWRVPHQDGRDPTRVVYEESPTSLPQCVPGALDGNVPEDCWQLTTDSVRCPTNGQRISVLRTALEIADQPLLPPGTKLGMQCRSCPLVTDGMASIAGCNY